MSETKKKKKSIQGPKQYEQIVRLLLLESWAVKTEIAAVSEKEEKSKVIEKNEKKIGIFCVLSAILCVDSISIRKRWVNHQRFLTEARSVTQQTLHRQG